MDIKQQFIALRMRGDYRGAEILRLGDKAQEYARRLTVVEGWLAEANGTCDYADYWVMAQTLTTKLSQTVIALSELRNGQVEVLPPA